MYADFVIRIEGGKAPGPFPVRVVESPAGEADGALVLPPGFEALIERVREDDPEPEVRRVFGKALFDALFGGLVGCTWYESRGLSRGRREDGLRLLLRFDDEGLARLPWELLHDGRAFLGTNGETPLSRYLPTSLEPLPFDASESLRVLAVLESPAGLPPITSEFRQAFQSSLADLGRNGVRSTILENPTLGEIQAALDKKVHVLHLVAHGQDSGKIALVDDDRTSTKGIDDREFAELFQGRPHLRLAVLSTCGSASGARGGPFAGVGPSLVRSGLPAVVAMQYPFVRQPSAGAFNRAFYKALAGGRPVDVAVNLGRQLLAADLGLDARDWSTPVLFMGTRSGQIVSLARTAIVATPPPPAEDLPATKGPVTKRIRILMPFDPGQPTQNGLLKLVYARLKYLIEDKINAGPLEVDGTTYLFEVGASLAVAGQWSADDLVAIRDADIVIGYVRGLNATMAYELVVRSLLRPELLLVLDGDPTSPSLSWATGMDVVRLGLSWADDPSMRRMATRGDLGPLQDFGGGLPPEPLKRLTASSDIGDEEVVSGLRNALGLILGGRRTKPPYAARVMEPLEPESLISGSSFYYPAALVKYTLLPRDRDGARRPSPSTGADLSGPPVICDWNPQYLEMLGLASPRPDDGPLTDDAIRQALRAIMDAEDYAAYAQERDKLVEATILGPNVGLAGAPIKFNFAHPVRWYRNRSFLPCFVMKKGVGSPDMTHFVYALSIFFDVTRTADYNLYRYEPPGGD